MYPENCTYIKNEEDWANSKSLSIVLVQGEAPEGLISQQMARLAKDFHDCENVGFYINDTKDTEILIKRYALYKLPQICFFSNRRLIGAFDKLMNYNRTRELVSDWLDYKNGLAGC